MNMNCKYKYIYSTVYLLILIAFTGCSASVDIKAANDKSAQAQVKLNLGKILCDTIDSLTAGINEISASGTQSAPETAQIFSKQEIETAFSGSDFQDLKVEVPAKDSVSISGTIPSPENQKSFSDKGNLKIANFITCTKNSLTLILSPATLRTFASSLPEETRSYLDLLMAPVLTQESMSAQEYRELVSTVYGEKNGRRNGKRTGKNHTLPARRCFHKKDIAFQYGTRAYAGKQGRAEYSAVRIPYAFRAENIQHNLVAR